MAIGQRLTIFEIAETILNGVVAHYAAKTDAEVEPLPARRYVNAGDPALLAWDCEQLTVSLQGVGFGQAADASPLAPQVGPSAGVFAVRHAILEVSLVRCVPGPDDNGNPPSDLVLYEAGATFMRDCGMLSQALVEIASRIRQDLQPEGKVTAGEVVPAGPEGSFVAAVGLFQVSALGLA